MSDDEELALFLASGFDGDHRRTPDQYDGGFLTESSRTLISIREDLQSAHTLDEFRNVCVRLENFTRNYRNRLNHE